MTLSGYIYYVEILLLSVLPVAILKKEFASNASILSYEIFFSISIRHHHHRESLKEVERFPFRIMIYRLFLIEFEFFFSAATACSSLSEWFSQVSYTYVSEKKNRWKEEIEFHSGVRKVLRILMRDRVQLCVQQGTISSRVKSHPSLFYERKINDKCCRLTSEGCFAFTVQLRAVFMSW